MAKHPATFLDRDRSIIDDVEFIKLLPEALFYPFIIEAVNLLQKHFRLFIIINQSEITKEIITTNEVAEVKHYIVCF
jgi:histidinol phosphatase-like enzyme